MILIDKNLLGATDHVNILLTLSDVSVETTFKLSIHSKWDNKTHEVELSENISPYPSRYDSFNCDATVFNELKAGRYNYTVSEFNTGEVIETGILTVIDNTPTEEYVSIQPTETNDDYLSY